MKKENDLPNVWNYAKKISAIPEGAIGVNTNHPDKLRIFQDGKWQEFDGYEDLEERKVKKTKEEK